MSKLPRPDLRRLRAAVAVRDAGSATLVGAERLSQLALAIRAERVAKLKIAAPISLFHEVLPIGRLAVTVPPFAETGAVCLLPADYALASAPFVTPADLAEFEQVALPDGSILRGWVEDAFAAAGVAHQRRFIADSDLLASHLVSAGLGVAVIHPVAAGYFVNEVVSRPFQPALPFTYALLERADLSFGALAQELEEALRQAWLARERPEGSP